MLTAPSLELSPADDRTRLTIVHVVTVAAYGLLGFSKPYLVSNIAFVDLFIAAMAMVYLVHLADGSSRSRRETNDFVLPTCLILAGALIATTRLGLKFYVVEDLVRDVAAFLTFLAALDLLRRSSDRVVRAAIVAMMFSVGLLTLTLLADGALRGRGTFPNPNIPAHLLAFALVIFVTMPWFGRLRWLIVGVTLVGLYRTGSFGSALQIITVTSYLVTVRLLDHTRHREKARVAWFGSIVVVGLYAAFAVQSFLNNAASRDASGLSAARLDRSGSTRFLVWENALDNFFAHPLGAGPGSSRALDSLKYATEPHNEPLAYLSERGIIAFIGLITLWVVLFRMTRRGGTARAMVLAYVVASFFRETLHYRHWWLFLALAIVLDERSPALAARALHPTAARQP